MLVGFSSGGAVTLETAAVTPGVTKVFVYEVPFIVDDSRPPLADYEGHTTRLVAEGKLDELIEYFITVVAGIPAEFVGGIKQDQAMWTRMRAIAPTIPHDAAFMSEFMKGKPLPAGYGSKVQVPVLVGDGGASPTWLHNAAEALAKALPNASRKTLEGQTHSFAPRRSRRPLSNSSRGNAVKSATRTTAGIRTRCFSNTVLFLTEVLHLEIIHYDKEKEFVQCKLPSGETLEVFGSKSLWHCFTDTPDWEIIIADVRDRKT